MRGPDGWEEHGRITFAPPIFQRTDQQQHPPFAQHFTIPALGTEADDNRLRNPHIFCATAATR